MSYTLWICATVFAAVAATLIINWCVYRLCRSALVAALMGGLLPGLSIIGYSVYVQNRVPYGPAAIFIGIILAIPALLLCSITIVLAVLTASARGSTGPGQ
jgi:hypothetical protein